MISTASFRRIVLLGVLVASLAAAAGTATPVHACSCKPPGVALRGAAVVFAGRAVAVRDVGRRLLFSSAFPFVQLVPTGFGQVKTTFEVSRIWKGPVNGRITIETSADEGMCGINFAQGQEYIVYASGEGTGLSTNSCSQTRPLDAAGADLVALGDWTVPEALQQGTGSRLNWLPLAWIAAVLLLGMSVARTVRKRRTTNDQRRTKTTDDRPPTTDDRPPTTDDERPTTNDQ